MANSIATLTTLIFLFSSEISLTLGAKCVYYGSPGETGEQTATGERFNPMGLTCSTLPHLPFGSILQVRNQINGRVIQVRVNDRLGSNPSEDTIDLTYGAFGLIADHDDGVVPCSYTVISSFGSSGSSVSSGDGYSNDRTGAAGTNIDTDTDTGSGHFVTEIQVQSVQLQSDSYTAKSVPVPVPDTSSSTISGSGSHYHIFYTQQPYEQTDQQQQTQQYDTSVPVVSSDSGSYYYYY